jgi:outer membrane lipoprotein SlyB
MPFLSGGCASRLGGDDYSRGEARQTMSIRFAVVDSVRRVRIEGTKTAVGATVGAVTGGVLGRAVGRELGGHHHRGVSGSVGAAVGAVAGGVGGAAVEEAVTRQDGVEITVKLENGEYLAIVQADEGENFQPGERVRLIGGGKATRVARAPANQN